MGVFPVVEIIDPLLWISMVVGRSCKHPPPPHPWLVSLDYFLISMWVGESSYAGSSPAYGCVGLSWTKVASSTQLGEKSYMGDLPSAGWVTRFVDEDVVIHIGVGDFADDIFAIYVVCGAFRERSFRHIQKIYC